MDPSILKIQDGTILDQRFEILGVLGRGGFATVYRARQLDAERMVALKILGIRPGKDDAEIEHFSQRFFMEARSASSIDHPGIVGILDHGVTGGGIPFIAMELLEGETLEDDLTQGGAMPPERALRLFGQGLDALNAAHQAGIVHKDLKPSNLFIHHAHTPQERMTLLDFGVAAMTDADRGERLTATDQFIGTAPYCSPEYYEKKQVSPAVDVYQMGLVLAEALMGRRVVHTTNPLQAIMLHCTGALRLPWALLESPLGPVLRRALAQDPADRYPDAAAMRDALAEIDPGDVTPLTDDDLHRNVLIFPPKAKGPPSIEFTTADEALKNFGVGNADTLATFSSTRPGLAQHPLGDTYSGAETADLVVPSTDRHLSSPQPAPEVAEAPVEATPAASTTAPEAAKRSYDPPHVSEAITATPPRGVEAPPQLNSVNPPPSPTRPPWLMGGAAVLITLGVLGGLFVALGSDTDAEGDPEARRPANATTAAKTSPAPSEPPRQEPPATSGAALPINNAAPDPRANTPPIPIAPAPELNLLVDPPQATLEALREGSPSRRIKNGFTTLRATSKASPLPWELSVSSPQHRTANIRLEQADDGALLVRFDEDDGDPLVWGDPRRLAPDDLGRFTLKLTLDRANKPAANKGRKPFKKDWIVQ